MFFLLKQDIWAGNIVRKEIMVVLFDGRDEMLYAFWSTLKLNLLSNCETIMIYGMGNEPPRVEVCFHFIVG